MKKWHVVLAVVALNYALWIALSEVLHMISGASLSFHFEVLFVLFPALFLPTSPSLAVCILMSLIIGVHRPVPLGATILSVCLLWQLALWMRARLRRDHVGHLAGLAATLQVISILGWSLFLGDSGMTGSIYWIRILSEMTLSAAVVALLAGWWCRWQFQLLEEFGWSSDTN